MQARYYDPMIGRFYSNDPLGFRDIHSFNRYAYANNNPYKYTDPDGRKVKFVGSPTENFQAKATFNKVKNSSLNMFMRGTQLEASSNRHVIVADGGNTNPSSDPLPNNDPNASNGQGAGSLSILDPAGELTSTNSDGSQVVNSAEAVMAHEVFGHAVDIDNGEFHLAPSLNGESMHENSALETENAYKETVNEKPRDCHSNC